MSGCDRHTGQRRRNPPRAGRNGPAEGGSAALCRDMGPPPVAGCPPPAGACPLSAPAACCYFRPPQPRREEGGGERQRRAVRPGLPRRQVGAVRAARGGADSDGRRRAASPPPARCPEVRPPLPPARRPLAALSPSPLSGRRRPTAAGGRYSAEGTSSQASTSCGGGAAVSGRPVKTPLAPSSGPGGVAAGTAAAVGAAVRREPRGGRRAAALKGPSCVFGGREAESGFFSFEEVKELRREIGRRRGWSPGSEVGTSREGRACEAGGRADRPAVPLRARGVGRAGCPVRVSPSPGGLWRLCGS